MGGGGGGGGGKIFESTRTHGARIVDSAFRGCILRESVTSTPAHTPRRDVHIPSDVGATVRPRQQESAFLHVASVFPFGSFHSRGCTGMVHGRSVNVGYLDRLYHECT